SDEAEALFSVKPFYGSLCQDKYPYKIGGSSMKNYQRRVKQTFSNSRSPGCTRLNLAITLFASIKAVLNHAPRNCDHPQCDTTATLGDSPQDTSFSRLPIKR